MHWYHQLLQKKHRIKSLSTFLTKHLTTLSQMRPKYLLLVTFAYNTFNSPNIANFSQYELVFSRKPKLLLNLEMTSNIKDYYNLLNK